MRAVVLSAGALLVQHKDQSWLFGAPEGIKAELDSAGLEVPKVLFTTSLRAPGYGKLGPVLRYKESPLRMNGLAAMPVYATHGTDYTIEADDGSRILFSERGDVAASATQGYALALIKNKHEAASYGSNTVIWPWPDAEYSINGNEAVLLEQATKVWADPKDVPDNLKAIDSTNLTLEQSNYIARVAKGSGEAGKENWAIAIAQFKKSYKKDGDKWVKKEPDTAEKEMQMSDPNQVPFSIPPLVPVKRFGDVLTAALHTAYNDIADHYFSEGALSQDERMEVAGAVGPALSALREGLSAELLMRDISFVMNAIKESDEPIPEDFIKVFKSEDGTTRWAAISSAATWDKQGELFTTKAMDWAIAFGKLVGYKGPLRYKHIPGLDGGVCDTQVRIGDFLFESGYFYDDAIGLAMANKLKEEPSKWQISLGLAFAKDDLVNGQYSRAAIIERTMTDRPALPVTALSGSFKELDMKVMTESELAQAAKELGMDLTEVKMMYERAIAATNLFATKEDFITQLKSNGMGTETAAKKDGPEEDLELEDITKVTKEDLVEILKGLTESEWKELDDALDIVVKTEKKGKKMTKAEEEAEVEEEDDEEEDSAFEGAAPKFKKKEADDDRLSRLENLVLKQMDTVNALTVALAGSSPTRQSVDEAVANYISQVPREQAARFVSNTQTRVKEQPKDEDVLAKLKSIEDKLASNGSVYDLFTSQHLNKR